MDEFESNYETEALKEKLNDLVAEYGLENVFDLIVDKLPIDILESIILELEQEI